MYFKPPPLSENVAGREDFLFIYHMATDVLEEGQAAPDFTLPGTDGDHEFEQYELADYTDAGAVVLVFYPFDFSPVCTTELCDFRDAEWLSMTADVDVFGISRDACYAHAQFIQEYNLTYPLLSDVDGTATEAYQVKYDEWEMHPGIPKRAVYIIDETETIQYTWVTEDAYESPAIKDIARELAPLSTTELDPETFM